MMNFKILNATRRKLAQAIHKRVRTVRRRLSFGWNARSSLAVYIGLLGSVFSSAAGAACELTPEWSAAAQAIPLIQIPTAIVVDSNTPLGVIWSTPISVPAEQRITNFSPDCHGTMTATGLNNGVPGNPGENNVYATNVMGIGYRIRSATQMFPFEVTRNLSFWKWPSSPQMEDLTFELLKTGPIQYGEKLNGGIYGAAVIQTNGGQQLPVIAIAVAAGSAVKKTPCTPDTRNLTISLDKVSTTQLESSSGMNFKLFSINLNCENDVDLEVQVRADSERPTEGLINADAGSEAQGVVVELRREDNQPVQINSYEEYGPIGTQGTTLSFKARLKRKSAAMPIVLGNFVASATLLLFYK